MINIGNNNQSITGDSNKQVIIGKQKAKSITNQFKPTQEQVKQMIDALNEKIGEEAKLQDVKISSWTKQVNQTLTLEVKKAIADAYRKECETNPQLERLTINFDDLKKGAEDTIKKIIDIVKSQEKVTKQFAGLKSDIEAEIENLYSLCGDILYCVRLVYQQCNINNTDIKDVKDLIISYIKLAELRDKQLSSAIETSVKANEDQAEIIPSHLAMDKIAEMFAVIKEIKEKQDKGEDVRGFISQYNEDLQTQYNQIVDDIDSMKKFNAESEKRASEILDLARDTNIGVKEANKKLYTLHSEIEAIKDLLKNKSEILSQLNKEGDVIAGSNLQGEALAEAHATINKLQTQLQIVESKLAEIVSNGNKAEFPCPHCLTKEERYIINGHCECTVCGHRFKDISPNVRDKTDEEIKNDWIKDHSAQLEQVSEDIGNKKYNLYRMELKKYTVSNNGALVIPSETFDHKKVTNIAFCRPNTNDKESQDRLLNVKTLLFESGLEKQLINDFNGNYPFSVSDLPKLTKVMIWDKKSRCYIEDKNTLKKLRGDETNA